jgi:LmbE family N-acetylglucosaminyl deacetylase
MVIQSPERNWDRIGASHPDHLAAGEAAIQAVYPDSRNPFAFTDLKDEGFEPWRVKEVWVTGSPQPNHAVDITSTFNKKIAALHAHVSQTAHNKELENMVRSWGEMNAERFELPQGSVAEIFRIVNTN